MGRRLHGGFGGKGSSITNVPRQRNGMFQDYPSGDTWSIDLVLGDLDQAIRQTQEVCFRCSDAAPGQNEVASARQPNQCGQAIGAAGAGQDADLDLGKAYGGSRGEDSKVGAKAQLQPAAQGGAGNSRDGRDGQGGKPSICVSERSEEGLHSNTWLWSVRRAWTTEVEDVLIRCHGNPLLEIGTSTEGMIALAGEDQCPRMAGGLFGMQTLDQLVQFGEQLARQGIARLGPVEGEDGDGAGMGCGHVGEANGRREGAAMADGGHALSRGDST